MPIRKYDALYGGRGSASKALESMKEQYGDKKGTSVFYALANKRRAASPKSKYGRTS